MKRILAAVLAAVCMMSLAACGGNKDAGKQPPTADVVKAVSDGLTFRDTLMTMDTEVVYNLYTGLDKEKVEDISMYASATRSTAEEVTVIKVKDAADLQMAKDAVNVRIEDQKIAYEDYNAQEMVKINGAVVLTHGNYVLLVMADDTASVEKTFEAQF